MSQENVIWDRTLGKYIYYTNIRKRSVVCESLRLFVIFHFFSLLLSYPKMIILSMEKPSTFSDQLFTATARHFTVLCVFTVNHSNSTTTTTTKKRYDGKLFSEKKSTQNIKKKTKDSVVFRTFFTHFHGNC